jgi:hypothetical protein
MAKEQSLSLSPTKISGLCGRLMCCLKYEQTAMRTRESACPASDEVTTPTERERSSKNNLLRERVKVKLLLPDGTFDLKEYALADVRRDDSPPESPTRAASPAPAAADEDEDESAAGVLAGIESGVRRRKDDSVPPDFGRLSPFG